MKKQIDYRSILSVALPVAFQSLIQTSLGVIDQMMVSRLGGTFIAAAGLANHPLTILFFLLLGVAGGTGIFAAQYFGDRQYDRIGGVVRVSYQYGLLITVPLMALAGLAPGFILSFFTRDQSVLIAGSAYLRIIALTFVPLMIILINSSALKSCGNVKLPFAAGVIAVISNTILNYVFIYGIGSFSGWGLTGAAVATLMARVIESLILIWGISRLGNKLGIGKLHLFSRKLSHAMAGEMDKDYRSVAGPLILGEMVFITSITFYTILYGRMGTVEMAAVTVLMPLQNITFGLFSGMSTAAAVLIGQALGRGDKDYAQKLAGAIIRVTGTAALLICALYVLIMPLYLELFALEDSIYSMTSALSWMIILFLPPRVLNMVLGDGIIKSGGETAFMLKMALFSLAGIGIPMGIFAGFYLKLPLIWVYAAVSLEEIVRMIIGLVKMRSGTWRVNLTSKSERAQTA